MKARYALGALAAALGLAAAAVGPLPHADGAAPPIAPLDLAEWIRARKDGLRVVDLRDRSAFDEEHVPSAEPMEIAELRSEVHPTETVVLCASEASALARAAALLQATGHRNVFQLRGGVPAWRDEVMFPALPAGASPSERAAYERAAALSRYFGGSPRKGAPEGTPSPPRPRGC